MQNAIVIIKIALPVIAALCFCTLPRTFKNNVYFGIQLSSEQAEQKNVGKIVRIYELSTALCGFIPAAINLYFSLYAESAISDMVSVLALFCTALISVVFYMMAAKAIRIYKVLTTHTQQSDSANKPAHNTTPLPVGFTEGALCPSPWWYLLHAGIICLCFLILYIMYDDMAPYVSLWCDFGGHSVLIAEKSMRVLSIPILFQTLFTLICLYISLKIKNAPLKLTGIDARRELEKSRKNRALWCAYVCILSLTADLSAYAYINFMFLLPEYKAFAVIILFFVFVLTLAATLFTAYISTKNSSS